MIRPDWLRTQMGENKEKTPETPELRIKGLLSEKGVRIPKKQNVDELSTRGYGTPEDDGLLLTFYEALYLMDKGVLEVEGKRGRKADFRKLLQCFRDIDKNAWPMYLAYRDLRSRGYVLREGFGLGVDFRVYERGDYGKDTAKYLILSIQEGKPVSLEDLAKALQQCQSLKKELILAVMNRRGEAVYYSVSKLVLA